MSEKLFLWSNKILGDRQMFVGLVGHVYFESKPALFVTLKRVPLCPLKADVLTMKVC